MAIQKMKKLRLMAIRSQKEALMEDLLRIGCVEVREPKTEELNDPSLTDKLKREDSDLAQYKTQEANVQKAVDIIDKYVKKEGGLLTPRPEVSEAEILDDSTIEDSLKVADSISAEEDRIKRIEAEQSRLQANIDALMPWQNFDVPVECTGTENTALITGTAPVKVELEKFQNAVATVTDEAELFEIGADKTSRYIAVVCTKAYKDQINEALHLNGFSSNAMPDVKGKPVDNIASAYGKIKELDSEKAEIVARLSTKGEERKSLQLAIDKLKTKINKAESEEKLLGLSSSVVLEGYCLEEKEAELEKVLAKYDCAYETQEPTTEEYEEVPVSLKNNAVGNAANFITSMYALPVYGSVDPNPLIAPFFILFYGLMMADMGYGILMIVAGLLFLKKKKVKTSGWLSFSRLMVFGGISTFIFGAITGGFFADAPYQFIHMINPDSTWEGLPYLFSPLNDSVYVLAGAMCLGLIQLNVGMIISFVKKKKRGQILDAVLYEGALWVMLIGILAIVLKAGIVGKVILVIGLLALFYGAIKDAKGLGKVTGIFGVIYNEATGWFGDILSYSRIMALMLAGSVIGEVFNTIAGITNNVVLFIIIFLFGHTLNFGLNLLGCYVHDLRLQCLEYFNKFYEDGGKEFKPLSVQTKYYDIT